jgi:hypothetical protein
MSIDQLHDLLVASEPPYTIATKGGKTYYVADRSHIWIPDAYKEILCLAIPRQGLMYLRLNSIESVHTEHEVAAPL